MKGPKKQNKQAKILTKNSEEKPMFQKHIRAKQQQNKAMLKNNDRYELGIKDINFQSFPHTLHTLGLYQTQIHFKALAKSDHV